MGTDQAVIVENQLAATDHSHRGQLLTYAAGLEAAYIDWVTPEFREEHRQALDWLNEVTRENISFFGVELELLRIVQVNGAASPPAPHFKLVAQPDNWQKHARSLTVSSDTSLPRERRLAYQAFFTNMLEQIAGEQLSWEPLENRRASRVAVYRHGRITETKRLEELKRFAVDAFFKFREAFGPRIAQLTVPPGELVTSTDGTAE